MAELAALLQGHVDAGLLPGAVAVCGELEDADVVAVGRQDLQHATPMSRWSLFFWDSLGKPLTAAVALTLVADGTLGLTDPIETWLPELAGPRVLRSAGAALGDTVPADRPVSVEDLLTLRGGLGFTPDFETPLTGALVERLGEGPNPRAINRADFLAAAGALPLAHQPGAGWTYNTGSTLLGLLVERASGASLEVAMSERVFGPLGMRDARWWVAAADRGRFTSRYGRTDDPERPLALIDPPEGAFAGPPVFPDGAGGVIGTIDDWLAFASMLLHRGSHDGRRVLPSELVTAMMTDQLTDDQRESAGLFLEGSRGEGWGYGGSVRADGSYGWAGAAGTSGRVDPRHGTVSILFTQVAMDGPQGSDLQTAFEEVAARS